MVRQKTKMEDGKKRKWKQRRQNKQDGGRECILSPQRQQLSMDKRQKIGSNW